MKTSFGPTGTALPGTAHTMLTSVIAQFIDHQTGTICLPSTSPWAYISTDAGPNSLFTRRADPRLPVGSYGDLIVNVERGQSRPKCACGEDPDRHDWATFTFTIIAEVHVRSCCTEMTKESWYF